MRVSGIKLLCAMLLTTTAAFAQGSQNRDDSILFGVLPASSQAIAGYDRRVSTARGFAIQQCFAHQLFSTSAGNLHVEVPFTYVLPGETAPSSETGSRRLLGLFLAPGVRLTMPSTSRLSVYVMAGGGYGSFRYPQLSVGSGTLEFRRTLHGLFDFGGGIDLRLSRSFSVRAEFRDYVTGRGLSGIAGRHHPVPLAGIALHF